MMKSLTWTLCVDSLLPWALIVPDMQNLLHRARQQRRQWHMLPRRRAALRCVVFPWTSTHRTARAASPTRLGCSAWSADTSTVTSAGAASLTRLSRTSRASQTTPVLCATLSVSWEAQCLSHGSAVIAPPLCLWASMIPPPPHPHLSSVNAGHQGRGRKGHWDLK